MANVRFRGVYPQIVEKVWITVDNLLCYVGKSRVCRKLTMRGQRTGFAGFGIFKVAHTFTYFTHNLKRWNLRLHQPFLVLPTGKPSGYYDYLYISTYLRYCERVTDFKTLTSVFGVSDRLKVTRGAA